MTKWHRPVGQSMVLSSCTVYFFYLWFITSHRNAIPLLDNVPSSARRVQSESSKTSFSQEYKHTRNCSWSIRSVGTRACLAGCKVFSVNEATTHVAITCGSFAAPEETFASLFVVAPSLSSPSVVTSASSYKHNVSPPHSHVWGAVPGRHRSHANVAAPQPSRLRNTGIPLF